jgi:hypothetical protein
MGTELGSNLVFIVGAPRSGTTWVQRLLAAHPRVRTGQESKLFRSYISPQMAAWRWEAEREQHPHTATGRGGTGLSCYLTEEQFLPLLRGYTQRLLDAMTPGLGPGDLFVEKTPAHALCLPEIRLLLPEARIIHILRDGRDVVASLLAAQRSWGAGWAPHAASSAAATWALFVRAVRDNACAPTHFREIRYEQLASEPEGTLRDLLGFLDLESDEGQIAAAVRANAADEVRSGRGTAIQLGGRFADTGTVRDPPEFIRRALAGGWRHDLTPFEKFATWRRAGDLLNELGYEWPIFDRIRRRRPAHQPLRATVSPPREAA